ncbi:MAG: nitric oxide synthase oxygenase [Jatrophihabitantaceae bacterium]
MTIGERIGCPAQVAEPAGMSTSAGICGALPPDQVAAEARAFYALDEVRAAVAPHRLTEVLDSIATTGTYQHTSEELLVGAKLAWRNHARCSGRYNWRSLRVLDFRHLGSAAEIADACFEHLRVSTNDGRLRAVISIFAPRRPGHVGPRIHNPQLIRYAGYQTASGMVGDPQHLSLTEHIQAMGWRGAGTAFDVLPLLVSVDGEAPSLFEVPPDAVIEVSIGHPEYPWFEDLGLRWHANPAISNLCLDIGGVQYPAAPFSGWYVSSEIGARNLSDHNRYDMLPTIASKMGLCTRRNDTLWKDRALVELNRAILWSYHRANVYIVDHHTAASQFVSHVERERRQGRAVPADWAWVNPPLSASTTPTFHRMFDPVDFSVRPNFYAESATTWPRCRPEDVS